MARMKLVAASRSMRCVPRVGLDLLRFGFFYRQLFFSRELPRERLESIWESSVSCLPKYALGYPEYPEYPGKPRTLSKLFAPRQTLLDCLKKVITDYPEQVLDDWRTGRGLARPVQD